MPVDELKDPTSHEPEGVDVEEEVRLLLLRALYERKPISELVESESEEKLQRLICSAQRYFASLVGITLVEPIVERLQPLIVDPINRLPESKRRIRGRVYSGAEIARAIPDVDAFLKEVDAMYEGTFFELNEDGQLVMRERVYPYKEFDFASRNYESFNEAKMRLFRIVYIGDDGCVQVMTGAEYYQEIDDILVRTEAAKRIDPKKIRMVRDLPTFFNDNTGEYGRMGNEKGISCIFVNDPTLDPKRARVGKWDKWIGLMSYETGADYRLYGSLGVLKVNLNLES